MTVMNSKVTLLKRKTSQLDEDSPLSTGFASSFRFDCPARELALVTAGVPGTDSRLPSHLHLV